MKMQKGREIYSRRAKAREEEVVVARHFLFYYLAGNSALICGSSASRVR